MLKGAYKIIEGLSVEDSKKMYLEALKLSRTKYSKRYFLLSAIHNLKMAEMNLLICKPEAASLVHSLITVLNSLEMEPVDKDKETTHNEI